MPLKYSSKTGVSAGPPISSPQEGGGRNEQAEASAPKMTMLARAHGAFLDIAVSFRLGRRLAGSTLWLPNGLRICGAPLWGGRPASPDQYRAQAKHPAG